MSSPGGEKVTRDVSPWSKDYHTPEATMDTDKILRSTLTEETHTQKGDTKTYLLSSRPCTTPSSHSRDSPTGFLINSPTTRPLV
jgi:hypothetical protein